MDKLSRLTTEDRENIIAYLDGELDEETTRRIETVLVQSSVARNDVEVLSRTYDLLDGLPRPNAPKDFVERTVATAKLEEVRTPLTNQPWYQTTRKVSVLVGWTALMIAAATLGAWGTNQLSRNESDELIEELPVIQKLDEYQEVGSQEFLNRLSAEGELLTEMQKEAADE